MASLTYEITVSVPGWARLSAHCLLWVANQAVTLATWIVTRSVRAKR